MCKEFKLLDFIGSNKLTIDDFIIIISDIQLLVKFIWTYQQRIEMFKNLRNLFWNSTRAKSISDIYKLTKVRNLKNMFAPYCRDIGAHFLYEDFQAIYE